MDVYKWKDELGNESNRYFLKEADCNLDVKEWKRFGYKCIGEDIEYIQCKVKLPASDETLRYLALWFMFNRIEDLTRKDIEEINEIYNILAEKIPILKVVDTSQLYGYLQTLTQKEINRILLNFEKNFKYLYALFIDCYEDMTNGYNHEHVCHR